jgi:hypothetical protein
MRADEVGCVWILFLDVFVAKRITQYHSLIHTLGPPRPVKGDSFTLLVAYKLLSVLERCMSWLYNFQQCESVIRTIRE